MKKGVNFASVKVKAINLKSQVECALCEYKHKRLGSVPDCKECITSRYDLQREYPPEYFKVEFESIAHEGWTYGDRMIDKWMRSGSPKVYLEKDVGATRLSPSALIYLFIILGLVYWQVTYWYGFIFDDPITLEDSTAVEIQLTSEQSESLKKEYESPTDYYSFDTD